MSSAFLIDYIVWVYISTLGVIQFAAVRSGLLGMLFIRRWPKATLVATVVTVLSAFTWYFASAERNQPDTGLGLDANVQAFWFATSATLAAGTTLAISSITNYRWGKDHGWDERAGEAPPAGINWLSRTTFFHAIRARLTHARRSPPERAKV